MIVLLDIDLNSTKSQSFWTWVGCVQERTEQNENVETKLGGCEGNGGLSFRSCVRHTRKVTQAFACKIWFTKVLLKKFMLNFWGEKCVFFSKLYGTKVHTPSTTEQTRREKALKAIFEAFFLSLLPADRQVHFVSKSLSCSHARMRDHFHLLMRTNQRMSLGAFSKLRQNWTQSRTCFSGESNSPKLSVRVSGSTVSVCRVLCAWLIWTWECSFPHHNSVLLEYSVQYGCSFVGR